MQHYDVLENFVDWNFTRLEKPKVWSSEALEIYLHWLLLLLIS